MEIFSSHDQPKRVLDQHELKRVPRSDTEINKQKWLYQQIDYKRQLKIMEKNIKMEGKTISGGNQQHQPEHSAEASLFSIPGIACRWQTMKINPKL